MSTTNFFSLDCCGLTRKQVIWFCPRVVLVRITKTEFKTLSIVHERWTSKVIHCHALSCYGKPLPDLVEKLQLSNRVITKSPWRDRAKKLSQFENNRQCDEKQVTFYEG